MSSPDRLKLTKYAHTLIETGLSEFDVQQQTSSRADEMMARRYAFVELKLLST